MFKEREKIEAYGDREWVPAEYAGESTTRGLHVAKLLSGENAGRYGLFNSDDIRPIPAQPIIDPFTAETFPPLNQVELRRPAYPMERFAPSSCNRTSVFGCGIGTTPINLKEVGGITYEQMVERYEIRINGSSWQPCGIARK